MKSLLCALLLAGLVPTLSADDTKWSGTCQVHFSGESTLHDFEGDVTTEPFTVTIAGMENPAQASASSGVTVNAAEMDTGNDKRDAEMHKCMDVTNHPEITVSVVELAVSATKPAMDGAMPRPTVVPFQMTVMGKTHSITGQVSDWSYTDGDATFTVSFPVSLKACGIKPPGVLGVVKVKDEIQVQAKLHLKRK